jgi:hypothetical protein
VHEKSVLSVVGLLIASNIFFAGGRSLLEPAVASSPQSLQVVQRQVSVPKPKNPNTPDKLRPFSLSCPSGMHALSGGYRVPGTTLQNVTGLVTSSYPMSGGWQFVLSAPLGGRFTFFAACSSTSSTVVLHLLAGIFLTRLFSSH